MTKMMSSVSLCDVVELDISTVDREKDFEHIKFLSKELVPAILGKPKVISPNSLKKNIEKSIQNVADIEVIDDTLYITLQEGTEITITAGSDEIDVKKKVEDIVFGYVVDYATYPFVVYHDGISAHFVPYKSIEGKVLHAYRHAFAEDETFRFQLTHNFIMPDIVAHLSGESCNYDAVSLMYGCTSLNYIYITLAFLGMKFPDEWAKDGAPIDLITDYKYGFREI